MSIAKLALIAVALPLLCGCGGTNDQPKVTVTIFHADSLLLPFAEIERQFEAANPSIDVKRSSSGSNLAARKITDMAMKCDIIAVADYRIIEKLLIPKHASWSLRFATNEIVLAYGNESKFASEIKPDNWHEILLRDGVNYGHSNPELDPCGYWTLISWQLADLHYGPTPDGKKLSEELARRCPAKNIRADLNELHPLLGSVLDYAFIYRSVAMQHRLNFVTLPPEISLGDPKHAETYKQASVVVEDTKGNTVTRTGTPIVFAITMLNDAPQSEAALKFLEALFSPTGREIMADHGQALLEPLLAIKGQPVPEALRDGVVFE